MSDTKKKAARKHRRSATQGDGAPNLRSLMKCALCALPITVAVGLLLLLITTALLLLFKDPDRYHTAAALVLLYLTAFLGGMIATRLYRRRSPLLCGLSEAMLLLLLITVAAFFLPDGWKDHQSAGMALLTRVLLLPVSLGGALLAARKKTPKRKRTHN